MRTACHTSCPSGSVGTSSRAQGISHLEALSPACRRQRTCFRSKERQRLCCAAMGMNVNAASTV